MKKNQLQITNLKMLLLITAMLLSVSWVQAVTYYVKDTPPNVLANWGTNTDGTGTAPSNFTTTGDVFIIPNGRNVTTNGNWTIGTTANGGTWELRVEGTLNVANTISMQARTNGIGSTVTLNVNGSTGKISFTSAGQVNVNTTGNVINPRFNLNSGGTLATSNVNGITGANASINSTNLTLSLNTAANYEFNGTANQATTGMPATVNNLTINNSAGVTLSATTTVSGNLTQTSGNIATGTNTLTVNGTHNAGTNIVTGAGTYTIANTGTLITANLDGITTSGATGTIQTTTRNYNTSNYVFNGGADQVSGNGLPVTLGTVTVQNNSGVFSLTNSYTNINTLNLSPGAKLTVTTGQTVNPTQLNIQSDANGTATILNEGTFNPTQTTAQQYVDTIRNWYMSPVVAAATPTGTGTIYRYHEYNKSWETVSSVVADSGHIVIPSAVASTLTFTGTLNDGSRSIKLTNTPGAKAGFNLVGNPYPSYLDVATPVSGNANIDQTIWYRTTYSNNNKLYTFETYGILLDVGTDLTGRGEVTGIVAPMQSFWLKANATTNLSLSNTNRSHAGVTANPLRVKAKANAVSQTLRLEVSNGSNIDQTIIAFNENASDALDIYDSEKWSNNNVAIPEIFTSVTGKELVINGMATSDPVEFVNVGFRTTDPTVRTYTITLSKMNNFAPGTEIILYDGVTANFLTLGHSYSFLSGPVNDPSRFTLIIRAPGAITAINDNNTGDVKIISNEKNQISIFVNSALNSDASVAIYNLNGQLVKNQAITTSRTQIDVQKGMYLVHVTNAGTSTTAKVIIQ